MSAAFGIEIPVVETERLILRAPKDGDLEAEAAFYAGPRSHFLGGPMTRSEVWRMIAARIGHWAVRGFGMWCVEEKATGDYVARVGLYEPEGWPEPEIGWAVWDGHEGRGLAHEAALAARQYAYDRLGWTTAISLIAEGNDRSERLAARLGARFESVFSHEEFGALRVFRHPGPA